MTVRSWISILSPQTCLDSPGSVIYPEETQRFSMCGRFTIAITVGLAERFSAAAPPEVFRPRFNIAPTQNVPVIIAGNDSGDKKRELIVMRWGLIPFFAKEPGTWSTINARSETVAERPAFRGALKDRRCLVPATGFFEWRKDRGGKIPFYITRRDKSLFSFAGLYDRWQSPGGGDPVRSFTILTRSAAGWMTPVHERMPVILTLAGEGTWLQAGTLSETDRNDLFQPPGEEEMDVYRVSRAVNDVSRDEPSLIVPEGA